MILKAKAPRGLHQGCCPYKKAAWVRGKTVRTGDTRGEVDPVKACDDKNRATLIACLASNRLVVVRAEGTH